MNISKRTMILFFAAIVLIAGAYFSFKADRQEPEAEPEEETEETEEETEEVQTETTPTNEPIQKETGTTGTVTE